MVTATSSPGRPPGMHDVARVAGVSHQTVSRVVNGHPSVSPATRTRVLQAIADLGYRRNTAARALVTRRSRTLGVVTLSTTLFGPTSTLLSVEAAARRAGWFVSVASTVAVGPADLDPAFEHFADQAVEGVVVIAPHLAAARAAEALAGRVPLVMVADLPRGSGIRSVAVDQRGGARLAVRHLLELGHRDIAHLAGPDDYFDAHARTLGWRQELRAHGVRPGALAHGDWSAASGYRACQDLLAEGVPDAVFVGNDLMALGAVRALGEAGLDVPGDVSVVGFDDMDGSDYFGPPLTTVRQDFTALGRRAIELLQQLIDGATPPRAASIPAELVRRSSTAARG
ncbi:LacI family DNA-binding transcriptional regulator [Nakamurella endophytica]|uniref:LacI family transcriptional regulator n=1 Tax=Nakamurella endophytica TaxID=1748367 RepID=A0A917SXA4_9ACTN|nr:LacI family DNA-binding transcriptional regulator [Nakamurella endophytica]GGM02396.1 LacI family transcriptional regulator [Nakamurella endophytica]